MIVSAPRGYHEGVDFTILLGIESDDGSRYTASQTSGTNWRASVTMNIRNGNNEAVLNGVTTRDFYNGLATFSDLQFSREGIYMELTFRMEYPLDRLAPITISMTVSRREFGVWLSIDNEILGNEDSPPTAIVEVDSEFDLDIIIYDMVTGMPSSDIDWRNHNFDCTISLADAFEHAGVMHGDSLTATFTSDGRAVLSNLMFDAPDHYGIRIDVVSYPSGYGFTTFGYVEVRASDYKHPAGSVVRNVRIVFDMEYPSDDGEQMLFIAALKKDMADVLNNVHIDNFALSQGSVVVDFTMQGTNQSLDLALEELSVYVTEGCQVNFYNEDVMCQNYIEIDGQTVQEDEEEEEEDDGGFPLWAMIVIPLAIALFLFLMIVLCICGYKKFQSRQTDHSHSKENLHHGGGRITPVSSFDSPPPYGSEHSFYSQRSDTVVWNDQKGDYVSDSRGPSAKSGGRRRRSVGSARSNPSLTSDDRPSSSQSKQEVVAAITPRTARDSRPSVVAVPTVGE